MELIAKGDYHSAFCSLYTGSCTDQFSIPEEIKAKMLSDFPDLFDVVGGKPAPVKKDAEEAAEVVTPEDGMEVQNQEAKMPKTRKK